MSDTFLIYEKVAPVQQPGGLSITLRFTLHAIITSTYLERGSSSTLDIINSNACGRRGLTSPSPGSSAVVHYFSKAG